MSTRDYLKFYGEDKYWNVDLKKDFMSQTGNMWRGLTDKYNGHIFKTGSSNNEEQALMVNIPFFNHYLANEGRKRVRGGKEEAWSH